MQKYGGSFFRALAALYVAAEPDNRGLIVATWWHDWQRYGQMGHDTEKARAQ
jgi:hypothetical protein